MLGSHRTGKSLASQESPETPHHNTKCDDIVVIVLLSLISLYYDGNVLQTPG